MQSKITTSKLIQMKEKGEKITALTAYDYQFAQMVDEAGVEIVLVGDSLGMVVQGKATTLPVTMDEISAPTYPILLYNGLIHLQHSEFRYVDPQCKTGRKNRGLH